MMAKKLIRPIRSEADHDAAFNEIERYFENEPKPGTTEADRFDLLALIIEDYECKRWPIKPPEAIDAIRYRISCRRRMRLTETTGPNRYQHNPRVTMIMGWVG